MGTYLHHKESRLPRLARLLHRYDMKAIRRSKTQIVEGLEHVIAGTALYVVGPDDDLEDIKEAALEDMKSVLSRIGKTGEGVCVQASTLGSLEALREFLKSPAGKIPVSGISVGPVHKTDAMKAMMPETQELVDEAGVKIFSADIIYHLFDQFKAYTDNFKEEKKKEASEEAVYPCVLQIMPDCVFNKRGPIVLGVDVVEGIAKDILRTKELKADAKLNVPGLLVIDTHGHESFANLRSRGSGLCDITILEVDIMHGLEPQTIESLNLLKRRNTEFIVAWNKVDRIYGWKVCRSAPLVKAMKQQSKDVQIEFNAKLTQVITQLKEQGLNTKLYYRNKEMGETYSTVPTCAISGEGIPDLLLLLVQWTQETMIEKLTYSNEVQGGQTLWVNSLPERTNCEGNEATIQRCPNRVITQLKEQGLNTKLYYRCKEMGETYSIVPTSAISGEGIPDLLLLLVQWTQKTMIEKLMYSNEVQCTVLVVKVQGHGATIDVVLVNGTYCYLNSSITDAPSNVLTPSKDMIELD
ncbi:unnamed protein product [Camellia sinensis]